MCIYIKGEDAYVIKIGLDETLSIEEVGLIQLAFEEALKVHPFI